MVTFIIPAYNAEKYIADAIESILAQSVSDWRMIIVDDGSSDATLKMAEQYASEDDRICVIHCDTPSGSPFIPRKIGIEHASTPLVAPLDADDRIEPDYLENLLAVMNDSGADAVYPMMYEWKGVISRPLVDPGNPESVSLTEGKELEATTGAMYNPKPGRDFIRLTIDGWKVHCNGGIISKNLYLKAFHDFHFDEKNVNADEVLTRLILLNADRVVFTREKYHYRVNPDSVTRNYSPRRFDALKAAVAVIDMMEKYFSRDSQEYMLANRSLLHSCAYYLQLINDEFPRSARHFGLQCVEEARKRIDFDLIRPYTRDRLRKLMSLPAGKAAFVIAVRDTTKRLAGRGKTRFKTLLRPVARSIKGRLSDFKHSRRELKVYADEIKALKKGELLKSSDSYIYKRNYYTPGQSNCVSSEGIIICPFDGTLHHGGLTDRLRGVLSTYAEAKRQNRQFYICWTSPFQLEEYLVPAQVDWRISHDKIVREGNVATPVVIQDIDPSVSKRITRAAISGLKGDLHIYSNSDAEAGHYKDLYHELFKPSPGLEAALRPHIQNLAGGYWSFTFRFGGLLGDFKDHVGAPLAPHEAELLMIRCLENLLHLMKSLPAGYKAHVTSDSKKFLDFIEASDSRIYVIPGDVKNIDLQIGAYKEAWLKTFIDQHLLMGAERVYRMLTHDMYPTGFPKFAAEVGGAKFIDYQF